LVRVAKHATTVIEVILLFSFFSFPWSEHDTLFVVAFNSSLFAYFELVFVWYSSRLINQTRRLIAIEIVLVRVSEQSATRMRLTSP
jgi:hypothetical protein